MHSPGIRYGLLADSGEHNESYGSIKYEEYPDHLSNYQLVMDLLSYIRMSISCNVPPACPVSHF
jgi:hypothetical protein